VRHFLQDVASIALPFIRQATMLDDEDLVELIRGGNTLTQISVARRDNVAPAVSHELVTTGKKTVVKTVLANESAEVPEGSLLAVVKSFGELPSVQRLLIDRAELPAAITEKLSSLVLGPLAERLVQQHHMPCQFVDGLSTKRESSERDANLSVPSDDVEMDLARISILKTLCEGHFDCFVMLMALRAGVSTGNARTLINDAGPDGFPALYKQTGLPDSLFAAFRIALDVLLDHRRRGENGWGAAETQRIVERLGQAYDNLEGESLDLILEQLS
jgi:uncharacterized protein (DUF2336 family)